MRIAIAQLDYTVGAFDANLALMLRLLPRLGSEGPIWSSSPSSRPSAIPPAISSNAAISSIAICASSIAWRRCRTIRSGSSSVMSIAILRPRQGPLQLGRTVCRRPAGGAIPQVSAAVLRCL